MARAERTATAGDALLHPAAIAAVALLLLNDHVLKATSPGFLTGKLSDFAGLAFFPLVLLSAWELATAAGGRWRGPSSGPLVVATLATAVVFVGTKASAPGNAATGAALGWLQWVAASPLAAIGVTSSPVYRPVVVVQDPTDLAGLAALAVCLFIGHSRIASSHQWGDQ
jgi:hypothetical protein